MTAETRFLTREPHPNQVTQGAIATGAGAMLVDGAKHVWMLFALGTPVDGTSGTGAGWAGPGSQFTDCTGANLYINGGTTASPVWKLVTRAA